MPGVPFSYHFMPNHRYERYYTAFAAAPPNFAFIMDASRDDYLAVKSQAPNAKIILRSYEWSDGGLDVLHRIARDPVGTGRWMAEQWLRRIREWGIVDLENTWFTGSNEYTVIPNMPIPPFVTAERVFAETLALGGAKACICNLGVGHPAETKDGKVDWSPYVEWEGVLQKTGGILGLHEYWRGEFGPRMNVKPVDEAKGLFWYAWRFMQCPFDVPIAITECGIDQKVDAPMGTPSKGWLGTVPANEYVSQLVQYNTKAVEDPRYLGEVAFCHDYASDEWASYDSDRALDRMKLAAQGMRQIKWYKPGGIPAPQPPDPAPVTKTAVLPLPAGKYTITSYWNAGPGKRHEGTDLGAAAGIAVQSIADGVVAYVGDNRTEQPPPVNGGYGLYIRVWHPQLSLYSFYAHLNTQEVKVGDIVKAGQRIGGVGTTGNSTGNHLHFETRLAVQGGAYNPKTPLGNGRADPESIMSQFGVSLREGQAH